MKQIRLGQRSWWIPPRYITWDYRWKAQAFRAGDEYGNPMIAVILPFLGMLAIRTDKNTSIEETW